MGMGGMGMGMGYGMGGMGRYGGYGGGHHGYRGSAMRLPWMGVLAATAVAGGAAASYPRGARSQVTWKEGNKQVSAQVRFENWVGGRQTRRTGARRMTRTCSKLLLFFLVQLFFT